LLRCALIFLRLANKQKPTPLDAGGDASIYQF
jgi:hypothetical protein